MSWGTLMISWETIIISGMTCTQDIVYEYPRYHKCIHGINLLPTTSPYMHPRYTLLPTISFCSPRHQICTHDMHVPKTSWVHVVGSNYHILGYIWQNAPTTSLCSPRYQNVPKTSMMSWVHLAFPPRHVPKTSKCNP